MTQKAKYTINHHGLQLGSHHFEFSLTTALFELFAESQIERAEGLITIELTKHASMLEANVSIVGEVDLACDRCADTYTQPIDYKGAVIIKISEEQGQYDGDIIWIKPQQEVVDLTEWIYESVILSLPLQRVHPSIEQCNADAIKYIAGVEN